MSDVSITIDAETYKEFLRVAPEKIDKIMQRVIYKGSLLVEKYGKINAPVDTGRLRASISTSIYPMRAEVSTHVNYARFVHDGTRYITGRPFMDMAAHSAQAQISGIIEDELKALS